MDIFKNAIIIVLILFGIVMTSLYWYEISDKERYMKDKETNLQQKEVNLTLRENKVVEREVCMKELADSKQLQTSIMELIRKAG
jgi:cell division protein FtsI/penicillin-binding protein 2